MTTEQTNTHAHAHATSSTALVAEEFIMALPSLMMLVGDAPALLLQKLQYLFNEKSNGVVKEGFRWIYNTAEQWCDQYFKHWRSYQLQRILNYLEDRGLVVSKTLRSNRYNRQKYSRINYDALNEQLAWMREAMDAETEAAYLEAVRKFGDFALDLHDRIYSPWRDSELVAQALGKKPSRRGKVKPAQAQADDQTKLDRHDFDLQDLENRNDNDIVYQPDQKITTSFTGLVKNVVIQSIQRIQSKEDDEHKILSPLETGTEGTDHNETTPEENIMDASFREALNDESRLAPGAAEAPALGVRDLHRKLFGVIAEVTKFNPNDKALASRIGRTATKLRTVYDVSSPEQVRQFNEWWFKNDWRGQRNQRPLPENITETWMKYCDGEETQIRAHVVTAESVQDVTDGAKQILNGWRESGFLQS